MKIPPFLLPHKATVEPYLGDGAYGPQYGPGVDYKCRIEYNRQLVRDTEGREVTSNTQGTFEYKGEKIPPESKVTWIDENNQVIDEFIVISAPPQTALKNVSHIEVRM
ncbi:hypothetical protein [Salinibacillus kushneri]|nr:hypothetical protein [Salinibacillus kushneri]